jgi:D-arabinose 1-dehydrogenase-like Zn-dependent alcohol dehydrogenase
VDRGGLAVKVTPAIDGTFPLDRVGEATQSLQAGQVRGKVVITM